MNSSKGFNSYRERNFSFRNLNSSKKIIFIVIGLLIIGLILFFLFSSDTIRESEPLLKMVSGTEYISGEQGQVIVRLQDSRDNAITDANCVLSLLYPDKSFFLVDVPMVPTSVPGNYYHPFITPEREGIYEEHIVCRVERNDVVRELHISYAFHVSTGLNLIVEVSRAQREQYDDLVNRVNSLDLKLNNVQTYIDTNVMSEVNSLSQDINDVNASINSSMDGIEARMNETMMNNFDALYSRFRDSYNAMASIFSGE